MLCDPFSMFGYKFTPDDCQFHLVGGQDSVANGEVFEATRHFLWIVGGPSGNGKSHLVKNLITFLGGRSAEIQTEQFEHPEGGIAGGLESETFDNALKVALVISGSDQSAFSAMGSSSAPKSSITQQCT